MRRVRICYFTAMAVLFLAARLTGYRGLFLLLFMMMFVVVYSVALNLWTIFSFSYLQEISERKSVKGRTVQLKIGIYNGKPFPFTMMRIRVDTVLPSDKIVLGFNLAPKSHIYYDLPLHCAYRGVHKVGMTTIELNDIFGLVRFNFDMRSLPYYRQREPAVLPRLTALPLLPARIRDTKRAGGGSPTTAGGGDSYAGLRQYRPGDSPARLHWPASVRARDLFVRHYERPVESSVLVAIDTSAVFDGEDALRYADLVCECAAALANYGLQNGFAVRIVTADIARPVAEVCSRRDFTSFYESLVTLPFGIDGDLAVSLRAQTRMHDAPRAVYALTARPDENLSLTLTDLARTGCGVKCYFISPGNIDTSRQIRNITPLPGVSCRNIYFGEDVALALSGDE